jgi:hypothetical protein
MEIGDDGGDEFMFNSWSCGFGKEEKEGERRRGRDTSQS